MEKECKRLFATQVESMLFVSDLYACIGSLSSLSWIVKAFVLVLLMVNTARPHRVCDLHLILYFLSGRYRVSLIVLFRRKLSLWSIFISVSLAITSPRINLLFLGAMSPNVSWGTNGLIFIPSSVITTSWNINISGQQEKTYRTTNSMVILWTLNGFCGSW